MFRPTKVKHYLKYMRQQGFADEQVLEGSRLSLTQLDDPACLIDIGQAQQVVANMLALSGNDNLGFELGREIRFEDFGIVGYALMSCKNIREVIRLWIAFSHSLIGVMLKIQLEEDGDEWRVTFSEIFPLGKLLKFFAEENLTFGQWIGASVTGQAIRYSRVELAYPEPHNSAEYEKVFNSPVVFNAPVTAVNVISPSLELTNTQQRDPELFSVCQRYCHQVMRQITRQRPLAFKIRQIFLDSPGCIPTLEKAASQLSYSPRSLRRHLRAEGVNYNQLINEFRSDLSKEYLAANCFTLSEIAYILGYHDPKSFSRAFKSWTGQSIQNYRKAGVCDDAD